MSLVAIVANPPVTFDKPEEHAIARPDVELVRSGRGRRRAQAAGIMA